MSAIAPSSQTSNTLHYPSADGKPVAESYDHLYAILTILEVLRQFLQGQQATVLANQFLYYAEGYPKLRVAPDVMVIFDVAPGGRDHYKAWEEGQVPKVIFEITSKSTRNEDILHKKILYEQLEVEEYWLFDPKGEWIPEQLVGYRLWSDSVEEEPLKHYSPIADFQSKALNLRLQVEGKLIGFYRLDTGEKLLLPDELAQALEAETVARSAAEQRAEAEAQRAEEAEQQLAQERQLREALLQQLHDSRRDRSTNRGIDIQTLQ
jgi:Uma2 family endonuclease